MATEHLTVERAEQALVDAIAAADRLQADLLAGSHEVTAEWLARVNDRVDFERARLAAAKEHDKRVRDPKRLAKIAAVLDGFHGDRFPKKAARVVELHDEARGAMAELVDILTDLQTDARDTKAQLHGLRPLTSDTEEDVKELDAIISLLRALGVSVRSADKALAAQLNVVRSDDGTYPLRIDRLRRVVGGAQLHAPPAPKVLLRLPAPIDARGRGKPKFREVLYAVKAAQKLVERGQAKYANPDDAPPPPPDLSDPAVLVALIEAEEDPDKRDALEQRLTRLRDRGETERRRRERAARGPMWSVP